MSYTTDNAHDACPLPDRSAKQGSVLQRMLKGKRIAVVGLSDDPSRASFGVASYLLSEGLEIIPVNPMVKTVMGLNSYATLEEVPGVIDVVNVFRRAEFCPDIVRSAIALGAKGVWLQSGVVSAEAQQLAAKAGIDFVQNRCLKVDHMMSRGG